MADRRLTPDELDRLLDGLLADGAEGDEHGLLHAARRVRSLADDPVPTDVRNRHLTSIRRAAAERVAAGAPSATGATSGWLAGIRRRAAAVAAAAGLAFTATGGGAVALAQDAGPDDLLYSVKRASESVALAVSGDDADLHLSFAERRLDEMEAAPDHAPELADEAVRQLGLAREGGADLSKAGVDAVQRLSEVIARLENDNARVAVSRACARIAEKHDRDGTSCDYDGTSRPGRSGDAPGRSSDAPGRGSDAPGRSSDAPGRSSVAPGRSDDAPRNGDAADTADDEDARPDDAGPPEGVPGRAGDGTEG